MAIWYRASPSENTQATFSGDGGLYVAGRWSYLGKKVIYCSESIALCTLEWLAHNGLSVSGFNYYRYSIDIPDDLTVKFSPSDLPADWKLTPATDSTRDFAENHLFSSNKILAIAVPSVIVPEESNLVINPLHKEFQRVAKTIKNLGQFVAPNR
jgi:RES domain-containing protein